MPSVSKLYLLVGPSLILLYILQGLFYAEAQALAIMQSQPNYKLITGLLLLILILTQWTLTIVRASKPNVARTEFTLSFHKWAGALSPLLLYLHSITLGNGYLAILSLLFLVNLALGFLSVGKIKSINIIYFQTWVLLHTLFSVAILVLTFFHIWVVFYFE